MEQSQATCTLKVKINCCDDCRTKAKEKLQKINGMEFIDCDSKGVLTISGKVNPMIIVKKIAKWGRKAELLSLEQSPNQATCKGNFHRESKSQTDNHRCCHCDSVSDSENQYGSEAGGSNKSNNPDVTSNGQITKSKANKWCFGLFPKKSEAKVTMVRAPAPPSTADGQSRWQFPRTPMLEYGGGPRPYYQPFRPYHPPPMMGRPPGPSHYPFGVMRPQLMPPLPPYGVFNSRPPPKVNPMIHYTSYADNYSPW